MNKITIFIFEILPFSEVILKITIFSQGNNFILLSHKFSNSLNIMSDSVKYLNIGFISVFIATFSKIQ